MTTSEIKSEKFAIDPGIEIEAPEVFNPKEGIVKVKLKNLKSEASWGTTKRCKGYKYSISGQRKENSLKKPLRFTKVRQSQFSCSLEKLINFIEDEKTKREFNRVFLEASEKMHAALIDAVLRMEDSEALG
jgi:hypothetical protein